MNLSVLMRSNKILADLTLSIVDYIEPDEPKIYFYDSSGLVLLCEIPFLGLEQIASEAGIAKYLFKSNDGSVLRNIVSQTGVVRKFQIHGKVEIGDSVDNAFIEGTVGSLTSSADLRFNKTSWQSGMNITITDLQITMK